MMTKKKAAVLFINGQSNAHAHHQYLSEEERITEPLKNVFGLDRDPNQSFDIQDVVWSGFTTAGKNLGESQDHTASLAYHTALLWQNAIDSGIALPDLYIVQVSIGSQGIINGMWNRDKEKVMKPGELKNVDISLYPWALQVNRLAMENLKKQGFATEAIGWHWIGSEQDILHAAYEREDFQERYDFFFDTMLEAIGAPCPLYLYKIFFQKACPRLGTPLESVDRVNEALLRQCDRFEDVTVVRPDLCPHWDLEHEHWGIFAEDNGHYLAKTQKWFADEFFADVIRRKKCFQ